MNIIAFLFLLPLVPSLIPIFLVILDALVTRVKRLLKN